MAWLISALGVVLALAGAASISAGIPYVRLEFGWTEVIAGTTALSAGIVTFALGAVLFALRGIRRHLGVGRVADGPALAIRTVLPFADQQIDPPIDAAEPVAVSPEPPVPSAPPRKGGLKERLRTVGLPKEGRDVTVRAPEHEPALSTRAPAAEAPALPPVLPAGSDDPFAGSRPSLDPPTLLRGDRYGRPADAAAADEPAPALSYGAAEAAGAPTVVGRYESGGASYVLFSDGTIEVETETGTHRFASMQDLRDHIEHQDRA